ncbi:MAG: calcium/sodium antiporter [Clostridia bacterium]|nr:calcium/sodium antiporter [Clostridia bacterium]
MDLASILLNSGLDGWLIIVISIALLGVGFVCLIKGADWFVDGAAGIAEKLRVPTLIIGLTVVSFGTSAPELATSIISAAQGSADLAIGNVIGSNITNILLILGVAAVICPLVVQKNALRIDFPVLLGASVLILLLGGFDGQIGRIDGAIMFVLSLAYMAFLVVYGVRESKKQPTVSALNDHAVEQTSLEDEKGFAGQKESSWYKKMCKHTWFLILVTVVGLALVVAGALFGVIPGATVVATKIGIPEKIIGLTVVAIGTSLPELVTCVIAAKKGETDIAVGDIVGSNIFNVIRTLGLCAIIIPLPFASSFWVDGIIALAAAIMLAVFGYIKGHKVRRWAGIVMLCCFAAYYVYLFAFTL